MGLQNWLSFLVIAKTMKTMSRQVTSKTKAQQSTHMIVSFETSHTPTGSDVSGGEHTAASVAN
eukprot:14122071-Ditylum_brightwellii.AAC.1